MSGNIGRGPELVLRQNTTLDQIGKFLDKAGSSDANRVRAYKNENNETVLYVSQKKTGAGAFFNRIGHNISGAAGKRSSLAREGLSQIADTLLSSAKSGKTLSENSAKALDAMLDSFKNERLDEGKVGAKETRELAKLNLVFKATTSVEMKQEQKLPPLSDYGLKKDDSWATNIAPGLNKIGANKVIPQFEKKALELKGKSNEARKDLDVDRNSVNQLKSEISKLEGFLSNVGTPDGGMAKLYTSHLSDLKDQLKLAETKLKQSEAKFNNAVKLEKEINTGKDALRQHAFEPVIAKLADDLKTQLLQTCPKDKLAAMKFSDSADLQTHVANLIKEGTEGKAKVELAPHAIAKEIVDRAVAMLSPDGIAPGESKEATKNGFKATLPPMSFGGTLYKPLELLGVGSFGKAALYEGPSGEKIAIKFAGNMNSNQKDVLADAGNEDANYRRLAEKGIGSSIGYIGSARLPNGLCAIAMEFAPHGDVQGFGSKLVKQIDTTDGPPKSGMITKAEAKLVKLTLLQDMAVGLSDLHRIDMTHMDFKAANVFIDKNGKGRIADFGTGREGQNLTWAELKSLQIDAPYYKSPELLLAQENVESRVEPEYKTYPEFVKDTLSNLYSNSKDKGKLDILLGMLPEGGTVEQLRTDEKSKDEIITSKTDVWGLGSGAVELFTGRTITANKDGELDRFVFESEEHIKVATQSDDYVALAPDVGGKVAKNSLGIATGDSDLDNLVDFILQPDPDQRPTASQILDQDVFKLPGVGSLEVRNLVAALASGDEQKIDEAREALAKSLKK